MRLRSGPPRGGQLAPGPIQVGAPNLRNILKLNKAPSKSGGGDKALTAALKDIKVVQYKNTIFLSLMLSDCSFTMLLCELP